MRVVYKYDFVLGQPPDDIVTVSLPRGAMILMVEEQHGEFKLWALVDPSLPNVERKFRIAGTGHPIEIAANLKHINSMKLQDGALVFHIFEVLE